MGINFAQRAAVSKMSLQTLREAKCERRWRIASRRLPPAGPGRGARRLGRRPEGVSIAAAPSQVSSDGRRLNQPAGARAHLCFCEPPLRSVCLRLLLTFDLSWPNSANNASQPWIHTLFVHQLAIWSALTDSLFSATCFEPPKHAKDSIANANQPTMASLLSFNN
jgi:hypothetical protein